MDKQLLEDDFPQRKPQLSLDPQVIESLWQHQRDALFHNTLQGCGYACGIHDRLWTVSKQTESLWLRVEQKLYPERFL